MRKREDNKLRMFEAVVTFLEENLLVISSITEMVNTLNVLKGLVQAISDKFSISKTSLYGKTQDKYDSEFDVIEYAMAVAGGLFAFGAKTENNELKETGNITRSFLDRLREVELVPIVTNLIEKARSVATELVPYGVTEVMITTLENFANEYNSALGKKESASGIKVGATGSLKELMNKADDTIEMLDKFSEIIKLTNPDFYLEYNSVRTIKNFGEGRTKEKILPSAPSAPDNKQ